MQKKAYDAFGSTWLSDTLELGPPGISGVVAGVPKFFATTSTIRCR